MANTSSTPKLGRAFDCRSIEERFVGRMDRPGNQDTRVEIDRDLGSPILHPGASGWVRLFQSAFVSVWPQPLSVKARQADKRRGSVAPVFVSGLFDGRGALCGVSVEEYIVHIVEIEIGVRDVRKGDRS